jgi:hypothetical protein
MSISEIANIVRENIVGSRRANEDTYTHQVLHSAMEQIHRGSILVKRTG